MTDIIEPSISTDEDIFHDGKVDLGAAGSLHIDADIFNQGILNSNIIGSLFTDTNTLNEGHIQIGSLPFKLINTATIVGRCSYRETCNINT